MVVKEDEQAIWSRGKCNAAARPAFENRTLYVIGANARTTQPHVSLCATHSFHVVYHYKYDASHKCHTDGRSADPILFFYL